MKKTLTMLALALAISLNASAQSDNAWTLNSRAWCTNYFTTLIFAAAESMVKEYATDDDSKAEKAFDHIIPDPDLVFPIGMGKSGFSDDGVYGDIYGPYHRAFSNPFKHIGDYAIGVDASWKPSIVGFYAGAFFKSQEIIFKETDDNLRGFYFQPRAGILFGSEKNWVEIGAFYDVLTGCGGSVADTNKKRLKGGFGLDIAATLFKDKDNNLTILHFSMPLHNFINEDYTGQAGLKRRVAYLMLSERITF